MSLAKLVETMLGDWKKAQNNFLTPGYVVQGVTTSALESLALGRVMHASKCAALEEMFTSINYLIDLYENSLKGDDPKDKVIKIR